MLSYLLVNNDLPLTLINLHWSIQRACCILWPVWNFSWWLLISHVQRWAMCSVFVTKIVLLALCGIKHLKLKLLLLEILSWHSHTLLNVRKLCMNIMEQKLCKTVI